MGDGVFWYTLIALLPYLHGRQGFFELIHILITAACALLVYKFLKTRLVRERPFINCKIIQQAAPALDRYSFPSGHTMYAFSFSIMLTYYLPQVGLLTWGFTGLIALSRVVLGLHYPTDVFAGALLGCVLSLTSLLLITV
jgi:undecaprenyl-diphosphatase